MNRCSKRSFGMKLIGLMTAVIMLSACCMPAFAAESETRTNTESFQLLTYSEDSASMGSGWTWEITLRIRSISLSATECMVFNPMETVYSCIKNPVCTNDLGVYNYENTAVRYDIYASRGNANYSGGEQPAIVWNLGEINPGDVITMKFRIDIQDYYYANFQLLNQFLDEGGRLFTTTGTDEGPRFVYNENGEQGSAEFDVPQADVSGGFVLKHHYLVNSEGQPIDENGNVVINTGSSLAAFTVDGEKVYRIDINGYVYDLVTVRSGKVGVLMYEGGPSISMRLIDSGSHEVEGYTRVGCVYNNGEFSTEPTYEVHINYNQSLNNLWIAYESNGSAFVPGDVNGDGQVMTDDALTAMRCALGLINLDASQLRAADMDGDGAVSTADALTILRLAICAR